MPQKEVAHAVDDTAIEKQACRICTLPGKRYGEAEEGPCWMNESLRRLDVWMEAKDDILQSLFRFLADERP